ncbi:WecB/TagA/CpsF family glycosyltransferase [Patescibacteria group bacterium]|nr:WecB/TagA/CpsF family glycosyltransferase [Patescibacteria group bacterium]
MKVNILGVEVDDLSEKEILENIEERLKEYRRVFIATPNPEMLILAHEDKEFKDILNSADIKLADGYGLQKGAKILGKKLNSHTTGTDFMVELCGWAKKKNLSVYLLGAGPEVAKRAKKNLQKIFSGLKIVGAESGGSFFAKATKDKVDDWDNRVILEHINATEPDILFVALGHGKQEKWIFENLPKLASAKIAMGVGGAFDFISGRAKRAPEWMRKRGLEWLWRLMQEPRRIGRIINAVIIFPFLCLTYKKQN